MTMLPPVPSLPATERPYRAAFLVIWIDPDGRTISDVGIYSESSPTVMRGGPKPIAVLSQMGRNYHEASKALRQHVLENPTYAFVTKHASWKRQEELARYYP